MDYTKAGTRLSWLLRHCREPLYIDLEGGWAPVEAILEALPATRQELEEIVARDSKGRFRFDDGGLRIRACQGHSIPGVVIPMERPTPPAYLYHGTAVRYLSSILRDGLQPRSRLWVHLSPDFDTAVTVGRRHGTPAVLRLDTRALIQGGHTLYRAANGVWQTTAIAPEQLELIWAEDPGRR